MEHDASQVTPDARATPATGRVLVVVSYVRDRSNYPPSRAGPAERRGDVYWANIAVNAATLAHVAPDVEFLACAGDTPPPRAASVLAAAGGRVRQVPFDHEPPDGFYRSYGGSLFLLDSMAALAPELADDDVVLFVDPDIVWARDPAPLVDEVRRGGVVAYDVQVPPDATVCEISRTELATITTEITGRAATLPVPVYFGGEFYGMRGRELREVVEEAAVLWDATLERFTEGRRHYHVEEHLMNGLLWLRGERAGRANPHLQRIRTLPPPFGTRERMAPGLVAWHLPYEKDRGIPRLLRRLDAGRAMPPPGRRYEQWLRRAMGVEPVGGRWIADVARRVKWRLTGLRPDERTALGL